jgi:hypothetical protein
MSGPGVTESGFVTDNDYPEAMTMKYFLLLLLFCSRLAFAGTAVDCLQFGATERAQSITNTCNEEVVVLWCHDSDRPDSFIQSGRCGTGGKFYRKQWVFKPGYTESNPYSVPLGAKISYGACFGGYWSLEVMDDHGGYLCKLPKAAAGDGAIYTSTAAAPSADEACNKATDMAKAEHGVVGQCACQTTGDSSICRVQSTGPKPEGSLIGSAKRKVRELAECEPEDKNCKRQRNRNVATGGRG